MKVYRLVSWIIIIAFSVAFIILLTLSYEESISYISAISGYGKTERIAQLLTPAKLNMIRFLPLLIIFFGVTMLVFQDALLNAIRVLWGWVRRIPDLITGHLLEHTTNEFLILMGILAINVTVKGYLAITFPITYDEAWTYINFTSRGVISSITYYPAPNNHVLNSVLTNIFSILPVQETTALRIPALLANTFFIFLFYIFTRRLTNEKVSLLLTLIACFLVPVMYYGFASRGYSLVMMFFTVCYFLVVQLTSTEQNQSRNLFYLSIASALGFYTLPSFLYPYITLNLFLLGYALHRKQRVLVMKTLMWGGFTTIVVALLYMPIFIISGLCAVMCNSYVAPIGRIEVLKGLFTHYSQTFEYLFNLRYALFPVYAIIIGAYFVTTRKTLALLNIWILVFSLLIPVIHSVLPFTRTWIYLFIPVLISLGLLLERIINGSTGKLYVRIVGTILALGMSLMSYRTIIRQEDYAIKANATTNFLLDNNIFSIYIEDPLMDTYIVYAYKINQLNLDCYIHEADFRKHIREVEMILYETGKKPGNIITAPVLSNKYYSIYRNPYYIPN